MRYTSALCFGAAVSLANKVCGIKRAIATLGRPFLTALAHVLLTEFLREWKIFWPHNLKNVSKIALVFDTLKREQSRSRKENLIHSLRFSTIDDETWKQTDSTTTTHMVFYIDMSTSTMKVSAMNADMLLGESSSDCRRGSGPFFTCPHEWQQGTTTGLLQKCWNNNKRTNVNNWIWTCHRVIHQNNHVDKWACRQHRQHQHQHKQSSCNTHVGRFTRPDSCPHV